MLSKSQLKHAVVKAFGFFDSKHLKNIKGSDIPLKMGLDSQDGVEFAVFLSETCNIEIPDHVNPFVKDLKSGKKARNINEIAELLEELQADVDGH